MLSCLLLPWSTANAADELQKLKNISAELVKIRQQIESLHQQITYSKDRYQDELRSYSSQKADLEVKISRSDLNNKELQRELEKLSELNRSKLESADQITPVLNASIQKLRSMTQISLPFKRDERINALDDIAHRLQTSLISPNKAANQLWAWIEDELILGTSSGLYTDTQEIDGEKKLVKVLRLGKVALFYRTTENQYGMVRQKNGRWESSKITLENQIAEVDDLFDSFAKNIRNGLFTLPSFLPEANS